MSAPGWRVDFLSDLSPRRYFRGDLFRHHQDRFLERYGAEVTGAVVEVGGERHYRHHRFFPRCDRFEVTNVARDFDTFLDATAIDRPDASQDAYVCVSVLEHVEDLRLVLDELARTLKPGGTLLLTMPFMYPHHDQRDLWRVAPDGWPALLADQFDIEVVAHLGGRVATVAMLLQRPTGRWNRRHLPYKLLGLLGLALLGRRDRLDSYPMAFGVVARRRVG